MSYHILFCLVFIVLRIKHIHNIIYQDVTSYKKTLTSLTKFYQDRLSNLSWTLY